MNDCTWKISSRVNFPFRRRTLRDLTSKHIDVVVIAPCVDVNTMVTCVLLATHLDQSAVEQHCKSGHWGRPFVLSDFSFSLFAVHYNTLVDAGAIAEFSGGPPFFRELPSTCDALRDFASFKTTVALSD